MVFDRTDIKILDLQEFIAKDVQEKMSAKFYFPNQEKVRIFRG